MIDLDVQSIQIAANTLANTSVSDRLKLNLFDPAPRFVAISGASGWGKSMLALSISLPHSNRGGNVCFLDTYIRSAGTPRDMATKGRHTLLSSPDASIQLVNTDCVIKSFSRITGVGCDLIHHTSGIPPLHKLLFNIKEKLLPSSVLVIDETNSFPGEPELVAREINSIIESGSSVVWISQDMDYLENLPVTRRVHKNAVFLLGRQWKPPSIHSFPYNPSIPSDVAKFCQELPMERDKFSGWLASVYESGNPVGAYAIKVDVQEIQSQIEEIY